MWQQGGRVSQIGRQNVGITAVNQSSTHVHPLVLLSTHTPRKRGDSGWHEDAHTLENNAVCFLDGLTRQFRRHRPGTAQPCDAKPEAKHARQTSSDNKCLFGSVQ